MKKYEHELPPFTEDEKEAYRLRFKHRLFRQIRALFRQRSAEGLTQKTIAARLGKDEASISRWLRGEKNLTLDTLCDVARAMDARIEATVRPLEEVRLIQSAHTATVMEPTETWDWFLARALGSETRIGCLRIEFGHRALSIDKMQILTVLEPSIEAKSTQTIASCGRLLDKGFFFSDRPFGNEAVR